MVKLTIDNKELEVEPGLTLIQACEIAGVEIPRFCYHEKLSIAGNCRMCLVEMEKSPKPVASCAMPVAEGMVIHTNSPLVKVAREGVMEFLLINHPLDCPICDQGGECDLQDQAMAYGRGKNRFEENKRAVKDKYMGPLIKTFMNRCIHCTRCIRFATQIAGVEEIGAIGRGEHMEVGTYVEAAISSELSGNMIDICPVGALTSKPTAYKYRTWELKSTNSIDVLDAIGSNIRIDSKGFEVIRILPRINDDINEEWISDKTRFACDGLKLQRLDQPMIKEDSKFKKTSWGETLSLVAGKLKKENPNNIAILAGDLTDVETMMAAKDLFDKLGSKNYESRTDKMKLSSSERGKYLFNTSIKSIEKSDLCLIIGANPRYEATLINARMRKRFLEDNFLVANIGSKLNLTYKVDELGNDIAILNEIEAETHEFASKLKSSKNPMIMIGTSILSRDDADDILRVIYSICKKYNVVRSDWNGYNILHKAASRVGALDIGFTMGEKNINDLYKRASEIKLLYLLGAEDIDISKFNNALVIYQGHHGDKSAHYADVILPGAAYTEKNATYVNLEGRVQKTYLAVFPPGEAKEDWIIIREIAKLLDIDLGYNSLREVRKKMSEINDVFKDINIIRKEEVTFSGEVLKLSSSEIVPDNENYYMTDSISRSSKTMAACVEEIQKLKVG